MNKYFTIIVLFSQISCFASTSTQDLAELEEKILKRATTFANDRANPITKKPEWILAFTSYAFKSILENPNRPIEDILNKGNKVSNSYPCFVCWDDAEIIPHFRAACNNFLNKQQEVHSDWLKIINTFNTKSM